MINFDIEENLFKENVNMIGVDEAGRGSWAGPLVATACFFDFRKYKFLHPDINDSKKLKSSKRREIMLSLKNFVNYSSAVASVKEIDTYGLSFANSIAMKRCIFSLIQRFNNKGININKKFCIYIDGKYKPNLTSLDEFLKTKKLKLKENSVKTLIKGDSLSKTIALAGIISKENRDTIMRHLSIQCPSYFFDKHYGYGTVKHRQAIQQNGISQFHRKSFKPIATIYSKIEL